MVSHADPTEHGVEEAITEQGIADLWGCSPRERASKLFGSCTHPKFHSDLREHVKIAYRIRRHEPQMLHQAFSWKRQQR